MANAVLLPKPGDLACLPIRGDGGRLVGVAEWLAELSVPGDLQDARRYQHVFVCLGYLAAEPGRNLEPWGWARPGWYCAQAEPGGARLGWLGTTAAEALALYGDEALWSTGRLFLTPAQRTGVCRAAIAKLGTPYSWLDYLALAAYHWHVPAPGIARHVQDSGHLICSQFADWCWRQAGYALFPGRLPGDVMPVDIARLILNSPARM